MFAHLDSVLTLDNFQTESQQLLIRIPSILYHRCTAHSIHLPNYKGFQKLLQVLHTVCAYIQFILDW